MLIDGYALDSLSMTWFRVGLDEVRARPSVRHGVLSRSTSRSMFQAPIDDEVE